MIGAMLAKIRKDMGLTKSEIAKLIGIDTGHLTHIEKGERKPSIKTLKLICKVCKIPYQPLLYTLDKDISKNAIKHNVIDHMSYTKILAFDDINNFSDFIDCPLDQPSASIAIKITDNSMEKTFDIGTYAYIELNSAPEYNDIVFVQYNGKFMLRRLTIHPSGAYILKADHPDFPDIKIKNYSNFYIMGKVIR